MTQQGSIFRRCRATSHFRFQRFAISHPAARAGSAEERRRQYYWKLLEMVCVVCDIVTYTRQSASTVLANWYLPSTQEYPHPTSHIPHRPTFHIPTSSHHHISHLVALSLWSVVLGHTPHIPSSSGAHTTPLSQLATVVSGSNQHQQKPLP